MSVNANAAVVTKAALATMGPPPSCVQSNGAEQSGMFRPVRARPAPPAAFLISYIQ